MKLNKGWIQIEPITEGTLSKTPIAGKGKTLDKLLRENDWDPQSEYLEKGTIVYYQGLPVIADNKFFIKEEQIIAYE